MFVACSGGGGNAYIIGTMPNVEDGYALGVSACYAATYDGRIMLAGGCNFPETPAAEGGAKRYYKGIYLSNGTDNLQWEQIGELPQPSAYGVSLQCGNRLIIAGGMNSDGAHSAVYMLSDEDGVCSVKELTPLPCTIDNAAGAIVGSRIYIVGGNADGCASSRVFTLDISAPESGWLEMAPFPGRGRVQPVCAATENALYVWGGFTPNDSTGSAKVHCDGAKFEFANGMWKPLPTMYDEGGDPFTLSGGTAVLYTPCHIVITGGVNRAIFEDAISGTYYYIPQKEYMLQSEGWYRFNDRLLVFDTRSEQWEIVARNSLFARAGALLATDGENLLYIGGELKPGIRTPEIVSIEDVVSY